MLSPIIGPIKKWDLERSLGSIFSTNTRSSPVGLYQYGVILGLKDLLTIFSEVVWVMKLKGVYKIQMDIRA